MNKLIIIFVLIAISLIVLFYPVSDDLLWSNSSNQEKIYVPIIQYLYIFSGIYFDVFNVEIIDRICVLAGKGNGWNDSECYNHPTPFNP